MASEAESLQQDFIAAEQIIGDTREEIVETVSFSDRSRFTLAHLIIRVFVLAIASCLFILLVAGVLKGDWYTVGSQATDLIKSVVLPVVTLVLGYYFGQAKQP